MKSVSKQEVAHQTEMMGSFWGKAGSAWLHPHYLVPLGRTL